MSKTPKEIRKKAFYCLPFLKDKKKNNINLLPTLINVTGCLGSGTSFRSNQSQNGGTLCNIHKCLW